MAINKQKNGRYKAEVILAGRGRERQRATRTFDTEAEAEAFVARVRRRPDAHGRTVLDAVNRYLDTYGRHKAPQTYNRHVSVRNTHIAGTWLGELELDHVEADDLERFYAEMLERGFATNTVRRVHGLLSVSFAKAVRPAKWMTANPCRDVEVEGPPAAPSAADEYDLADVARVLDTARRPRPAGRGASPKPYDHSADAQELDDLVHLAIATGARVGELAGLRWGDVELRTGVLTFYGSVSKPRCDDKEAPDWIRKPTKTGRARPVLVGESALAMLEARYLRHVAQLRDAGLADDELDDRAVLSRELERDWTSPAALSARWSRAAKAAAVPLRFHDLRHIAASEMTNRGVPVTIATARTGHASRRVFLDTYGHHRANLEDVGVPALEQTWETVQRARKRSGREVRTSETGDTTPG